MVSHLSAQLINVWYLHVIHLLNPVFLNHRFSQKGIQQVALAISFSLLPGSAALASPSVSASPLITPTSLSTLSSGSAMTAMTLTPPTPLIVTQALSEATTEAATMDAVGVVQHRDNLADWPAIIARLNHANIPYFVINWDTVQRRTDLNRVPVLLLPGIKQVSRGQAIALQRFVANSGHLVVSGEFGSTATTAIQQQLRSLVGAYWAGSMDHPTPLRPTSLRMDEEINENQPIAGGMLVPTGLRSHTLATWQESVEVSVPHRNTPVTVPTQGAPAVVVTLQTSFLGWNWGQGDADIEFDSTWLSLMLAQHVDIAPRDTNPRRSTILASDPTTLAVPPANILLAPNLPQLTTVTQADLDRIPVFQSPASVLPRTSNSTPPVSASPAPTLSAPTSPRSTVVPFSPSTVTGTIAPLEAIAMRQDIENLIGRFESALLSAHAIHYNSSLSLDSGNNNDNTGSVIQEETQALIENNDDNDDSSDNDDNNENRDNGNNEGNNDDKNSSSVLLASTTGSVGLTSRRSGRNATSSQSMESQLTEFQLTEYQLIVEQAEQLLEQFADAVGNRDYDAARTHWLDARRLLWDHFPSDRPIQQTEIRAIWFDRGSIVAAGSRQGLAEIFDRLADAGINTVFFETINAGYPIYPSAIAPAQNPLISRSWDPLADAVDLAHERGIELHAWVWTFAIGNQRHNTLINRPRHYPGPVLAAHPTWANYDQRGRMIPLGQNKPFLDPANPEVRDYLQQLFTEIVTQYDVDGLQLDYIRYPFQDPSGGRYYGYGQAARQQFRQQTGIDPLTLSPTNASRWQEWTDFRTQQIDTFISNLSAHLRQQRPDLILSTAVFPMPTHERLHKLQQNWEQWAAQGDIDLIVTMSYALDTNRFQRLTTPWLSDEATTIGPALILPGIRLLNLPNNVAIDQIQVLRDMPAGGYALFAVENFNNNPQLQSIFQQTQGQSTATIPYRHPFETAAERFDALNREWNFALSTHQLWIRGAELTDWHAQSHALQASLRQLAARPSLDQLSQTQVALEQYQQQFSEWMALYALEDEYRVQTWNHHLVVVQRLLDYGAHQLHLGKEFP